MCLFSQCHLPLTVPIPQNYLGHSINAPTGRWQKKKDVHWYNRELKSSEEERAEEIRKIKEAEAEALSVALYVDLILPLEHSFTRTHSGFGPSKKEPSSSTQGTGTNAIPITPSFSTPAGGHMSPDSGVKAAENAERRQRRRERKEEKAARRVRRAAREEQHRRVHNDRSRRSLMPVHQRRDSSSPSPKRHRSLDLINRDDPEDDRYLRRSREYRSPEHGRLYNRRSSRSRSPPRRDSRSHSELPPRPTKDRQRWNHNSTHQTSTGGGRKRASD